MWCNRLKGNHLTALFKFTVNRRKLDCNISLTYILHLSDMAGDLMTVTRINYSLSLQTNLAPRLVQLQFCLCFAWYLGFPYAFCVLKFRANSESGEHEINKLSRSVPQTDTLEDWAQRYYRPFVDFIAMFNPRTWTLCNRYSRRGNRNKTWNILTE